MQLLDARRRPTRSMRRWARRARSAADRRRTAWRESPRSALDAGFIGQVADDQLGEIFAHDMTSLGVRFETPPLKGGLPTGRCLILVTPDAQRTMNTFPGASHELTAEALDEQMIRSAAIIFLEGYLWGPERPRAAMLRGGADRACGGPQGRLHLVRKRLHRPAARRRARDDRRRHGRHAVRQRGRGHAAGRLPAISTARWRSSRRKVPTLVVTRGAAGAIAVERGERVEIPRGAGREGRRHDRRRRPVRRRLPRRPLPRPRPLERCLEAGAHRRGRSHLAFRRAARGRPQGHWCAYEQCEAARRLLRLGAGQRSGVRRCDARDRGGDGRAAASTWSTAAAGSG